LIHGWRILHPQTDGADYELQLGGAGLEVEILERRINLFEKNVIVFKRPSPSASRSLVAIRQVWHHVSRWLH